MNLARSAIEKPRIVVAGTVITCMLGLAALSTLPRERTPRVRMPIIVVSVENPAAESTTIESQIIEPIEDHASSLKSLRQRGGVISEAHDGAGIVQFSFSNRISVDTARRDVETLVDQLRGELPLEARNDPGPIVEDVAFEDWPVIQLLVAGGSTAEHRHQIVQRLKTEAEKLPGVAGVDLFGDYETEVHIEVNPRILSLYGLTHRQLGEALHRALAEQPGGAIEMESGSEIRVHTALPPESLSAIGQISIGTYKGSAVHVEDVAEVRTGRKPTYNRARFSGYEATVLLVRPQTDADLLDVAARVQRLAEEFRTSGQAEGAIIGTGRSLARQIQSMLFQLGSSAVWGGVTIFGLLLIFLGIRHAAVVVTAIPLAFLATAAGMWLAKGSLLPDLAINNMVLFAGILVMGLVVDGCIIVGENICRHRELGRSARSAAHLGINEVGRSLITACLTTCAAFAPMLMVGGVVGEFLEILPIVVLLALASALLIDHAVLPVLSIYFMKTERRNGTGTFGAVRARARSRSRRQVVRAYVRLLNVGIRRRSQVLCAAVLLPLVPIVAIGAGGIGLTFFPRSDIPIIEVHFELPLGSSLSRTEELAGRIEAAVNRAVRPEEWYRPGPRAVRAQPVTTIGQPAALNTNLDQPLGIGPEFGMVFVELQDAGRRDRSAAEIRDAIARELPELPGVKMHVRSPSDGPPAGAAVLVRIFGREHTTIETLAARAELVEATLSSAPGIRNVTSDHRLRPAVRVTPDRVMAALVGLDTEQITLAARYAIDGVRVAKTDFGGKDQIDLRVRSICSKRDSVDDLLDLPLRSSRGRIVSLGQVSNVKTNWRPNAIRHYDRQRTITIRAETEEGTTPDDIKAFLVKALRPELTPAERYRMVHADSTLIADSEVILEYGGENEARDEALKNLNVALMVATGAMMLILVFQFNSFRQTVIILFSVPLSLVGVAFGHIACGLPFSVSSMIGVVALSGIVVNDAIVVVDFYNRHRKDGYSPEEAGLRTGLIRMRPILLTTLTTVGGLLPLSLNIWGGGEFWQPLAVTIMSGLAAATLMQLFVLPVACSALCRGRIMGNSQYA